MPRQGRELAAHDRLISLLEWRESLWRVSLRGQVAVFTCLAVGFARQDLLLASKAIYTGIAFMLFRYSFAILLGLLIVRARRDLRRCTNEGGLNGNDRSNRGSLE